MYLYIYNCALYSSYSYNVNISWCLYHVISDVLCVLQDGDTPLHYASDHVAAIEVLLKLIMEQLAINQINNVSWHRQKLCTRGYEVKLNQLYL